MLRGGSAAGGGDMAEIHPRVALSNPRIGMYLKAGAGKDGNVVLPGWIADPDRGVGEVALEGNQRPR